MIFIKKAIIIFMVLISAINSQLLFASEGVDPITNPEEIPESYYVARRKMIAGIVVSSTAVAIGGPLISYSILLAGWGCGRECDNMLLGGLGTIALGLGTGIPMIVTGAKEKNRIMRDFRNQSEKTDISSVNLMIVPSRKPMLGLSMNF